MGSLFRRSPGMIESFLVVVFTAWTAIPAFAAEVHHFAVVEQDAPAAIRDFARQADVQILVMGHYVAGKKLHQVSGDLSTDQGLQQLLEGSGLMPRYVTNRSVALVLADRDADRLPLSRTDQESTAANPPAPTGQDTGTPESQTASLEEIVVTAQKRAERLQDAPLAVTALSGQTLTEVGLNDTRSLTALTPSLTYAQGANVNNSNFRIRGVGTQVFGAGLEPDVSVVVDGVVLARAAQGFSDLADIERVEVLRGPQGTLFGKNAIAGLLNVTTKQPSKELEGYADATFAEEGEYRFHGSLSGPLTDTLGFRLSGYYNDVGGNIENLTVHERVNNLYSDGFRGKLVWSALDDLKFTLIGDYRNAHGYCCSSVYVQVVNPTLQQLLLPVHAGINNRQDIDNALTWYTTGQSTFSLQGDLTLGGGATLTSLTAYQGFDFNNNQPIDRLNTPTPLYLPTSGQLDINGGPIHVGQLTQELRLTSPGGERLNYLVGLYYLDLNVNRGFDRRIGNCAPGGAPAAFGLPCVVPLYRSQGGFHSNEGDQNVAAFGQLDLQLLGGLSALGGVRVQHERVSYYGTRPDVRLVAGDLPLAGVAPSAGSGHTDDTATTGKVGLKYEFNRDSQTYLTWSTGYKGAGFDTEITANFVNQTPVKPEHAKAWELGYKTEVFGNRLRLNTALFYADYTDLQVQANRGDPALGIFTFAPTNAGKANSKGLELEFDSRPVPALTISGGVTYLLTKVDIDGLQCALSAQAGATVMTGTPINVCYKPSATASPLQNVRDGTLPQASKWRGNLLVRYDHDIPGIPIAGFLQTSVTSQSRSNFTIEQDPLAVQDAYTITDLSAGIRDRNDRYRLTVFVDNLFDRHYLNSIARSATLSTATLTPNQLTGTVPKDANRYFGVMVSGSF